MIKGASIYDPSIARFLSVDPLFEAFPNQSPYSYSFNNPLSYKDPSGLAPEKEKGGKNQIQNMDYHELLKESWKQYNTEYQIQLGRQMMWEKEGNSIFWNDQYNDLIRRANSIDIGIDYSVELAKRARQGRLGIGSAGGGNGIYIGFLPLGKIASINENTINSARAIADCHLNELRNNYPDGNGNYKEVGYLLRYNKDTKELFADFFVGKDSKTWISFEEDPYPKDHQLKPNESILGFNHTHNGKLDKFEFSAEDVRTLYGLMINEFGWTGNNPTGKYFMGVSTNDGSQSFYVYNRSKALVDLYQDVFSKPSGDYFSYWNFYLWNISDWTKYGIKFRR